MTGAPQGLTGSEAADRLQRHGPNAVPKAAPPSPWSRLSRQLTDPLVMLLLVAFVVTLVVGDMADAIIIGLVVVVNTTIGVVQELRAEKAIAALGAPGARVVRDGADQLVPAADLVVDDLVRLDAGDIVPTCSCSPRTGSPLTRPR